MLDVGSKRASVLVPLMNSHQGMLDVGSRVCWMLDVGSKRASVLVPLLNSHQGMLDVGVGYVGCWILEVRGHLFWFPC